MDDDHKKFLEHLDASHWAVQKVARYLDGKGLAVSIPETTKAKSRDEWKKHADAGDIILHQRIEVKHRSLNFTGHDDFPYDTIMVCAIHAYDNAVKKPSAYYMVNRAGTYAAVVRSSSHLNWSIKNVRDKRYSDLIQATYFCPAVLLNFVKF